ncbi:hypothetical protein BDD14_1431 [Edaphobacter modestus]|uniref:Caspase domain-containing protein n=1 Tax=Edaphobacter modestus TaxID=388466 RepID=A0A4V2G488_9BACT|nr:hypothetical protein BDD14_1431 [Edaphobacter modestus]
MRQALRRQIDRRTIIALFALLGMAAPQVRASTYYVVVAGLGGEPDYEQRFNAAAKDLEKTFKSAGTNTQAYVLSGPEATASHLKDTFRTVVNAARAEDDLVLILIGHGSFDGTEYKFNLPGPDVTGEEIADMCNHVPTRRQLIVDTSSASGGAMRAFERPGRAVVAATKSGTEKNATVFARYWVQALQDPASDTDKSGSIDALEAFTYASKKTAAFYDSQKRLSTEHAVFDDIGHGEPVREPDTKQGAYLASFTLFRFGKNQQAANDPAKRQLLMKKEELEQQIDILKYQKAAMDPADYKKQLTTMLLDLARVQQELDK